MTKYPKRNVEVDPKERRKRRRERILIVVTLLLIVILSFLENHISRQSAFPPVGNNILIFGLINVNIVLILLLVFLITRNVVKLVFELRQGIIGSKLRTKLVAAFVGLSLIPTVLLFLVSINFLSYSIDHWFNLKIGNALKNTVEVAQTYYQQAADHAKFYARQISSDIKANRLYEQERENYLRTLLEQRLKSYNIGSIEIYFDNRPGNIMVGASDIKEIKPTILSPQVREEVYTGKEVFSVNQSDSGDVVRGLAPIYSVAGTREVIGVVVVSNYLSRDLGAKMAVISNASEEYSQLTLLKNPIKQSYIITLALVTLLIIFSSIWFGVFLAKGITDPIQDLAEATRRIAAGNLDHQINVVADDEIGVLVDSFNQMTVDLKKSSENLETANVDLENRRKYMETVLRNVSAGVISIDKDGLITTINRAAEKLFGINTDAILNRHYEEVLGAEHLTIVRQLLTEIKESSDGFIERQVEVTLPEKSITVLMTTTLIENEEGNDMGMVVVFEDLTQLQMIERAAAWREVARRMAHEIKNPLTPVQLSAQRLQKKYGDKLGEDGAVFQECTKTIIDQVEVLKNLVNEFSKYARMPVTNMTLNDLNHVITDSVLLFQDAHKDITFNFSQGADMPKLNIDAEKIKRVMVNLLDNAVAAMNTEGSVIDVRTSYDETARRVCVEVADNGCGVPSKYKMKVFEPYFSTKKTGSGLGLAIVSSIISDHHGNVSVRDNDPCGTVVSFDFPVPENQAS
ncbi:MAG: HAMP domain-containing protein [Deltaproteobacteria bacterium]|nr:HAMP domain-containing protein [Deltaproteobacteria bacterium]